LEQGHLQSTQIREQGRGGPLSGADPRLQRQVSEQDHEQDLGGMKEIDGLLEVIRSTLSLYLQTDPSLKPKDAFLKAIDAVSVAIREGC
jgi:hypothetical protein